MRAEGRRSTPFAALSRGLVGVRGGSLIVNVPGPPASGALESFEVVVPLLDHALETLPDRSTTPPPVPGPRGPAAGEPASG